MKIIWCDSFDRDTVDDRLVAEGIKIKSEGEAMLNGLVAIRFPESDDWYRLVEDDYELKKWEP